MILNAQDYLTAFDGWLTDHIHAAVKSGKDFAFKDRRLNYAFKLDDDGAAWDYVLIEPGAMPPPGHSWTIYRLHGVAPAEVAVQPAPPPRPRRRMFAGGLAQAMFGRFHQPVLQAAMPQGAPHLRVVK